MSFPREFLPLTALAAVISCASSPGPAPSAPSGGSNGVLASGGELDATQTTGATVRRDGDAIVALGILEVPAHSRLQAAQAGADASARSELVKYIQTRVTSAMEDVIQQRHGQHHQEILLRTTELVRGHLGRGGSFRRGWVKLQGPEAPVLRVVSEVRINRAEIKSLLGQLPPELSGEGLEAAVFPGE